MTIRGRVVKMFMMVGVLMLLQALLVYYLHREGIGIRDSTMRARATTEHLHEAQLHLLEMQGAERGYAATGEHRMVDLYRRAEAAYVEHRKSVQTLLGADGQAELTRIDALIQDWMAHGAAAVIAARDRAGLVSATIAEESEPRWEVIHPALLRLEASEYERLSQREADTLNQMRRATMLMIVIPLLCALTLVYLSLDASIHTLRPMAALGRAAQHIARGEFVVPPPDGFSGEVEVVRQAFANMAMAIQQRELDLSAAFTRVLTVDRMKSEFVSIVSHELRTPLTSIRGALQLVLADETAVSDGEHRQLLTVALNNSERLTRIVNDILDVSKIESGQMVFDTRACRVDELVRVARQSVDRIASASDVRIVSRLPPNLAPVRADFDRAVQALVNLLSNAIKFAPAGSEVTVIAANRDEGPRKSGWVAIAVQDRGNGIAPDDLSRLFQKFQQLDPSSSRRVGGTGLGLAITKALIEQHGGRIEVESEVGRGSTFTIILPAASIGESAADVRGVDEDTGPIATARDGRARRVLVAEDDPGLLLVLTQVLTRSGCEVATARDGREAWMMATTQPPDLLLLDLAMPELDGFEVIRRVRATAASHDVPIIAISGSDRLGPSEQRARELGANAFLAKPLDAGRLVAKVQHYLKAKAQPPRWSPAAPTDATARKAGGDGPSGS